MRIQQLPLNLYEEPKRHGYRIFKHIREALDVLQTELKDHNVVIGSLNPRRLYLVFQEHGIPISLQQTFPLSPQKQICVIPLPIQHGYRIGDTVIFAEEEILGPIYAKQQTKAKIFRQDFDVGDYVVHKKHGIGQFLGLEKIKINEHIHECLKLLYSGQQKLYVPIEAFDNLSRYGDSDMSVTLDELGSLQFQKRKAKAKERINAICAELLQTAAKRKLVPAPIITYDPKLMDQFAEGFKYIETRDQLTAIHDVLSDLESGLIMDRIVCGDAGFGKTEVALRAIFATIQSGYQVAILTPTTTLCLQHYRTLQSRFDKSVHIAQISRLVSTTQQNETKKNLATGQTNIVVGTTGILSEQLAFKNLGLLIVDEEHHFGVKQKEKIKKLYPHVHVLSLSATPIPRTLQLSLAGIKELSLLSSPPVNRKPINTFTGAFDTIQIQQALQNEMERNGQIFWIVPRIRDMHDTQQTIKRLAPNARICLAHGGMDPEEIANLLIHFSEKKYDLILATSIIEAGVDFPDANTLIIQNSHLFGLAQLYQMRGRVGRSDIPAYAFLTYPENTILTHNAVKRLNAIQQLNKLGIGFSLATQDMDIRGYGNLVGSEQSGHIQEIGIELYQNLLESTLEQMKNHKTSDLEEQDVEINLNMPVYIPEDYIDTTHVRMELYNLIASLKTMDEIKNMKAELTDRFGSPPTPVLNLLEVIAIKQICRQCKISKINMGETGVLITFYHFPKQLLHIFSADKNITIRNNNSISIKYPPRQHLLVLKKILELLQVKLQEGSDAYSSPVYPNLESEKTNENHYNTV